MRSGATGRMSIAHERALQPRGDMWELEMPMEYLVSLWYLATVHKLGVSILMTLACSTSKDGMTQPYIVKTCK